MRTRLPPRWRLMLIVLVLAVIGVERWLQQTGSRSGGPPEVDVATAESGDRAVESGDRAVESGDRAVETAFRERARDRWLELSGQVDRVLADDRDGSRHQRFVVRLSSGRTVLVAHNIDLAPRVPLAVGDRVVVAGQYEWNERGGVVHWTHHDPDARQPGGWIELRGQRYR